MRLALLLLLAASQVAADEKYVPPLGGALPPQAAPVVLSVGPDWPAARAGIVAGDTLWSVDGWPIRSADDLKHVMIRRTSTAPARCVIGRKSGRQSLAITPRGTPQRLGLVLVNVLVDGPWVQIHDAGVSVASSISEWDSLAFVYVMVRNSGTESMTIAAASVSLVDGRGVAHRPLSMHDALVLEYGSEDPDAFDEPAADKRKRAEGIRDLRAFEMTSTRVRPGNESRGKLCFKRTGLVQPLTVRVTVSGRRYTMRFGR